MKQTDGVIELYRQGDSYHLTVLDLPSGQPVVTVTLTLQQAMSFVQGETVSMVPLVLGQNPERLGKSIQYHRITVRVPRDLAHWAALASTEQMIQSQAFRALCPDDLLEQGWVPWRYFPSPAFFTSGELRLIRWV